MNHKTLILIIGSTIYLTGCQHPDSLSKITAGKILRDSDGCAYMAMPLVADTHYQLTRVEDADKGACQP